MWCHNDKQYFKSTNLGQLNLNTVSGQQLIKIIKENDLKNIVDIGTWNGLGSTLCFLTAILNKTNKPDFISIECNTDKHLIAKNNLKEYLEKIPTAKLICGSIITDNDMKDIDNIFPTLNSNTEYNRWHSIDMENIKNTKCIINEIPETIDFILFDGGEFTTYFEFKKLLDRCIKYIALDDCNTDKCKLIRKLLLQNTDWKEDFYTAERNGFSIFKKV